MITIQLNPISCLSNSAFLQICVIFEQTQALVAANSLNSITTLLFEAVLNFRTVDATVMLTDSRLNLNANRSAYIESSLQFRKAIYQRIQVIIERCENNVMKH